MQSETLPKDPNGNKSNVTFWVVQSLCNFHLCKAYQIDNYVQYELA